MRGRSWCFFCLSSCCSTGATSPGSPRRGVLAKSPRSRSPPRFSSRYSSPSEFRAHPRGSRSGRSRSERWSSSGTLFTPAIFCLSKLLRSYCWPPWSASSFWRRRSWDNHDSAFVLPVAERRAVYHRRGRRAHPEECDHRVHEHRTDAEFRQPDARRFFELPRGREGTNSGIFCHGGGGLGGGGAVGPNLCALPA